VFLPFGILLLFIEEFFLSDQGFSRCIHGLAECSGQLGSGGGAVEAVGGEVGGGRH
jgi:hypothetical protein